ncbi:dipeptide/oligopeptide/nickel ABC transporter permease/ATP-binding protein [Streptomyces sp. SM11]|uniref:dipeptide/oligopeptide/nickel ABC transporter permease/ATP-binding protein n=1 Tax=Streptomyces sp. SM11 TaxID=565557 RepID=UPI000CD57A4B|nr:dipeptide/oligopeptide/nickel ABC transporter permease/ATP-binding protein [Streptomyces sp. SM11]
MKRGLLRNPLGFASVLVLAMAVLSAVLAPWLAPYAAHTGDIARALEAPGGQHLLGTDTSGGDVLSNLLYAGRYSLSGAALTLGVSSVIGISAGLVSGYFRGWFDTMADWAFGLLMALPGMIVLLAARAVIGPGLWSSMTIIGILITPVFYRLVRTAVLRVREELYVDAARVAGLTDARIIRRHILTVVRTPVIIQGAMVAGAAVALQAGLEFIGLGDPNIVTWGTMLNDGFRSIYTAPLLMLWPSAAIGLVCVACVLLANALRDALESGSGNRAEHDATAEGDAEAAATPWAHDEHAPIVHAAPATNTEDVLEVTDLRVGYAQPRGGTTEVVRGVGLRVRHGEIHGLVGESGSGKTQTAFAVLGVLSDGGQVTAGSVLYHGTELAGASEKTLAALRGRRIAYIPQEPMANLDPSFTIGEQLTEPLRLHLGMSRSQARTRALELLARVGLDDPTRVFASYPHQISGGMAQRVLIAGAVSCGPDLLIADEPTTALDVTIQAEVLDLLRGLRDEHDMAILLVTHNFGVVADLCDTVSVMKAGRIVETGPVRAIFHEPAHPYTRSLLAAILDGGPAREPWSAGTLPAGTPTTEPAPAEVSE